MRYKNLLLFLVAAIGFFSWQSAEAAGEAHPPGTLIVSEGAVYRITDDGTALEYFDNEAVFNSHFYNFADAVPANTVDINKPIKGSFGWGDGRLFNENGIIYQISGGFKKGFAHAEVFRSYGFDFTDAIKGVVNLPEGPAIEFPNLAHLPGSLVIENGTVWLLNSTGKIGVPSMGVLHSWGRKITDVVPANLEDSSQPVEGVLQYRTGTLVNDNGTIWSIRGKNKYSFDSSECFIGFGFKFTRTIIGSTSEYSDIGNICSQTPASSYERKKIETSRGTFSADIMKFNLANGEVKMLTDTANSEDCLNECPVKSVEQFVKDNGGFAGINGTYFCPTSYTSCAGKTNSFYWKVYNSRLGNMINDDNGVKTEQPFIAVNNNQVTYHRMYSSFIQTNTNITAGINSEPRLVENGAVVLDESALDSGERTTRTSRVSIGIKEQVVYIVEISSATIPDLAATMQAIGVDYAMALDGGGSTGLYYEGEYKLGPGRNVPNAIIFKK